MFMSSAKEIKYPVRNYDFEKSLECSHGFKIQCFFADLDECSSNPCMF